MQVGQATSQSKSAFLLQLAVRSAAGGNHPAAIDRSAIAVTLNPEGVCPSIIACLQTFWLQQGSLAVTTLSNVHTEASSALYHGRILITQLFLPA